MSDKVFVEAPLAERGDVAAYLVALSNEKGIHPREIKKCKGGYLVPAELLAEGGIEVTSFVQVEKVEDGSNVVVREPDVTVTEDAEGIHVQLIEPAEVDREVIRAWAKEAGLTVADKGQLKKIVTDAYYAAH